MHKGSTILGLMILAGLAGAGLARADGQTMYYQGFFEGQATPAPQGISGIVYHVDPGTIQPSFYESRYRHLPLQGTGAGQPDGQPLTVVSRAPLPGIYWYQDPVLNRGIPLCDLGWPYVQNR